MPTTKNKSKTIYVCGVDWQHEIGEAADGNKIYPSVESFKKYAGKHSGCGIVECSITLNKWVEEQDFKEMAKNAVPATELTKIQIKEIKEQIKRLKKFLKKLEEKIKINLKAKKESGQ